jgi:hypothetical protein
MTNPIFDGRIPPELLAEIERRIQENGVSASLPSVPPNTRYQWIERSINDGTIERERSIPAGMPSGLQLVLDNEFLSYVIQRGRRIHPDIENANLASTPTQAFPNLVQDLTDELQSRLVSYLDSGVSLSVAMADDISVEVVVTDYRVVRHRQMCVRLRIATIIAEGIPYAVGTVMGFLGVADIVLQEDLRSPERVRQTQLGIGNTDCAFNAKSLYIRCAVNPSGPCEGCLHFETQD